MTYGSNGQEITRLRHIDPLWLTHLHDYKLGTIFKSAGGKQWLNNAYSPT